MEWIQAAFRISLIGIGILILSVLFIALIIRLYRFLQVKVARDHKIQLTNQGNVRSIYHLTVQSPEPRLRFKLSYKGMPLIEIPETAIPEVYTAPTSPINHPGGPGKDSTIKRSNLDAAQTAAAGREVAGKVGLIASLLGSIGNLIPGSLGNQLRSKGASIRGVQTSTLKTTQEPLRTQRKISALKTDSSRFAGAGIDRENTSNSDQYTGAAGQTVVKVPPSLLRTRAAISGQPGIEYQAQTKEVDPGESILLTLRIDSRKKKRIPEGSYLYTIHSQQISLEPASVQIPPISSRGTVHFKAVPTWRYWLPLIVCGLVVLAAILSLTYYIMNV